MIADIRATFDSFPAWSQPIWTWLTGKASEREHAIPRINCWTYLAFSAGLFLGGAISSAAVFLIDRIAWPILFMSIPLTLTGARLLVLTIAHQCAHLHFCKSKSLNRIVHHVITIFLCAQDYDGYRHDHFKLHHGTRTFGTYEDPVLAFITGLGFKSSMSKRELWWHLIGLCFSPSFHARYLWRRIRSNVISGGIGRKIWFGLWWTAVAVAMLMSDRIALAITVGYLLPITILYQISAFLELICEHVWMRALDASGPRYRITELSWGRFCGEPVPWNGPATRWLRWSALMVLYHAPVRLLVLTGDAPQHDFHHAIPNNRGWMISAYERHLAVRDGRMEDIEVWGLFRAIDIVFECISIAASNGPKVAYLDISRGDTRHAEAIPAMRSS